METRHIPVLGKTVSRLGFGTWQIGGETTFGGQQVGWGHSDDASSLAALNKARELGINFFDTADTYGLGHSEMLLGQFLEGVEREEIVICTKFGNRLNSSGKAIKDYSGEWAKTSLRTSLERLKSKYADIFLLHSPESQTDWVQYDRSTLEDLKRRGLIRAYGVSCRSVKDAVNVVEAGFGNVIEVIYNALDRRAEDRLLPLCAERGVFCIARVPLAAGFLTERCLTEDLQFPETDIRSRIPIEDRIWRVTAVRSLKFLATLPGGFSSAALRFCLSNPAVGSVIAGMRTELQVEANVNGALAGELPETYLRKIREAVPEVCPLWKDS